MAASANIYLHYVLDLWFDRRVRKACEDESFLVRYADDFVAGFAHRGDAEAFWWSCASDFRTFGLKLSEAKTKLVDLAPDLPATGKVQGRRTSHGHSTFWVSRITCDADGEAEMRGEAQREASQPLLLKVKEF